MLQIEHDYQGIDYNLNAKAINIWPADLTGVYIGSYLQSFTKNLALGIEGFYHRQAPDMTELSTSYLAKYTGDNKDWIATAQLQPSGILQSTYWQKLSEKVEVAAELQVIATPIRRDAIATLGAKYDLRMSTFRAQVDSTGKVSALLEQRFAPSLAFLLSGEIDHFKVCVTPLRFDDLSYCLFQNTAKVGAGVMIESSSLTPEEMGLPPQP
jgi:mitochondrial import receptor subunit TOM40